MTLHVEERTTLYNLSIVTMSFVNVLINEHDDDDDDDDELF